MRVGSRNMSALGITAIKWKYGEGMRLVRDRYRYVIEERE